MKAELRFRRDTRVDRRGESVVNIEFALSDHHTRAKWVIHEPAKAEPSATKMCIGGMDDPPYVISSKARSRRPIVGSLTSYKSARKLAHRPNCRRSGINRSARIRKAAPNASPSDSLTSRSSVIESASITSGSHNVS